MARKRYISPGFFKNADLADLGPLAQLMFAGLWTIADREGRLKDDPRRIRVETLPFYDVTDAEVDSLLDSLGKGSDPFIYRYEVDGKKFIQVANWELHQSPHHKEVASILPCRNVKSTKGQARSKHKPSMTHAPLELELSSSPLELKEKKVVTDNFEAWWNAYPRKVGKGEARKAFAKALDRISARDATGGEHPPPEEFLICRALAFAVTPAGNAGKFTPHPATWLNQDRFDDDPETWQHREPNRNRHNTGRGGEGGERGL